MELLVCIAIVAVLVGILVAALARARGQAVRIQCLNNARSCAQAMSVYAGDFNDAFPNAADFQRGAAFSNGGIELSYWNQSGSWTVAMRGYLGHRRVSPQQWCPASELTKELKQGRIAEFLDQYPPGYVPHSEYWLSYNMLSGPQMWSAPPPPFVISHVRVVRQSEVRSPSAKGLLLETIPRHLLRQVQYGPPRIAAWTDEGATMPTTVALADGSVRSLRPDYLNRPQPPSIDPFLPVAPVLATRDGVAGVDVP